MAIHLRLCMLSAANINENRHPKRIINDLGITYQHCVPQSISESWEFWNCENVPDNLPTYLEIRDWNPMERVGWGLSRDTATKIAEYKSTQNCSNQDAT